MMVFSRREYVISVLSSTAERGSQKFSVSFKPSIWSLIHKNTFRMRTHSMLLLCEATRHVIFHPMPIRSIRNGSKIWRLANKLLACRDHGGRGEYVRYGGMEYAAFTDDFRFGEVLLSDPSRYNSFGCHSSHDVLFNYVKFVKKVEWMK